MHEFASPVGEKCGGKDLRAGPAAGRRRLGTRGSGRARRRRRGAAAAPPAGRPAAMMAVMCDDECDADAASSSLHGRHLASPQPSGRVLSICRPQQPPRTPHEHPPTRSPAAAWAPSAHTRGSDEGRIASHRQPPEPSLWPLSQKGAPQRQSSSRSHPLKVCAPRKTGRMRAVEVQGGAVARGRGRGEAGGIGGCAAPRPRRRKR